jgi:hypothetical protein
MGLAASRGRLLGGGWTSALTHRSISIVADGRLDVCDGAHRAFVMKNVEVGWRWSVKKSQAVGERGISLFKKRGVAQPREAGTEGTALLKPKAVFSLMVTDAACLRSRTGPKRREKNQGPPPACALRTPRTVTATWNGGGDTAHYESRLLWIQCGCGRDPALVLRR